MGVWQSLADCAGLENRRPWERGPGVRIPPLPPSVVVQEEEYLRRRRGDVWCYPPKPTEPKLNREDDVI